MSATAMGATGVHPDPRWLHGWWDETDRTYASLRAVNALRLDILRSWSTQWFGGVGPSRIVDLGCGGGLMAVPLARTGARVIAVDSDLAAMREGSGQNAAVGFVRGDAHSAPVASGSADLVLLCDVLEHLESPARAIAAAARILRPGGRLFVNTINRTLRARICAIWLGEGLGIVPRGTHRAAGFVTPAELQVMARSVGLHATDWCGEAPALFASLRRRVAVVHRSRSMAVGYCAGFRRESA